MRFRALSRKAKAIVIKAKSVVIDIIGAVIGILPSILKKKQYCLWYRGRDERWFLKAGPMSHRQCVKTMRALIELGTYLADRFAIFRKGVTP